MTLRALKAVLIACACWLSAPRVVWAQSFSGVGERAQGMGGAFVAVADDATASYWNPAGIANVFKFDTQLSTGRVHQGESDGGQTGFFGAALPALGVSYYRVWTAVSGDEGRQNDGSVEVRPSVVATNNVGVTLVQTVVRTVVVGATLRAVGASGSTGFDADLGVMAATGNVRLGLAARNIREGLGLERMVRAGLAYVPRALPTGLLGPLSIAVDVDLTRTSAPDRRYVAVGAEQWWRQGRWGTRIGVEWSAINEHAPAFSAGLTMKVTQLVFAEGHVTVGAHHATDWGTGLRMAF
jgi:hypothetical protein